MSEEPTAASLNAIRSVGLQHDGILAKLEVARWMLCALWLVSFTVGLPGNMLILCVYLAKRVRTTTHIFIGALAVADLLICLLRLADAVKMASSSSYLDFDQQQGVVHFLSRGLMFTTALLTTAIALDRFDAVCRSLHRTVTLRRAKTGATVCFAVGFIGILPDAGYKIYVDLQGEELEDILSIRSIVKFIPISLYILSLFVVAIFYGMIFAFVRKRTRMVSMPPEASTAHRDDVGDNISRPANEHQHATPGSNSLRVTSLVTSARAVSSIMSQASPSGHQRGGEGSSHSSDLPRAINPRPHPPNFQYRTTKMLFIATFLFFILWFPNVYLRIYALGSLVNDVLKSSHHANLVAALVVLQDTIYINSVLNAFVYSMANKRFRVECQTLIRRVRARF